MVTRQSHKRRGASFEIDLERELRYLLPAGIGYVNRLTRNGNKDRGDLSIQWEMGDEFTVIEAKAPGRDGRINLPDWWKQAVVEARNFEQAQPGSNVEPLLVVKARSKPVLQAWAIQPLGLWLEAQW